MATAKKKPKPTPKKESGKFWKILKKTLLILFVAQLLYIILLKWVFPPFTLTQVGSLISGEGLSRDYISLKKIDKDMRLAVIAAEDQLFPAHSGFDWKSITKAIEYNKKKPGRGRGASTLSQQTAKNVFLWQGRSYFRKGLEAYFTILIEIIWGKERIMEVYLNSIEMGDGVYGAEAATQYWYRKECSNLTKIEAAGIAAILPNPRKFKASNSSAFINGRKARIVKRMKQVGTLQY
jgi:monofunctional biosynthetic peptidoglycan transglycosylase